jgi:hypothetical protein
MRALAPILVLATLTAAACGRGAAVPSPSPGPFREAEAALASGDYVRADTLYRQMEAGEASQREIALARRAFVLALPGTPIEDREAAEALLVELRTEYPETLMGAEAAALLARLPEIDDLRLESDRLRAALAEAREERELLARFLERASPLSPSFDLEGARETYREILAAHSGGPARRASERILFLISQWQRLGADTAEQESRLQALGAEIESLADELDRLRELDLGRRLPD